MFELEKIQMGKGSILEEGDIEAFGRRGRKKPRDFRRVPTEEKYAGIRNMNSEEKLETFRKKESPQAQSLHVVERLPQETKPNKTKEEEITEIEGKIKKEFSDAEKEFVEIMTQKYPKELQAAKNKIERGGGAADDKWASAFRESYINDRKRFGMDKKRWGLNGPLAPEKAEIFEKYLELKLPTGLIEKKAENLQVQEKDGKKEIPFTEEQSTKLVALIREVRKIQDQVDLNDLQEIIEVIIREDLIAQDIFSEDDFPRAFEHVNKWLNKFNHTR